MSVVGPNNSSVSLWLTSIFRAPENKSEILVKDIAVRFGERFACRSPASLISKVMHGRRGLKIDELAFFEEIFADRFPPPWSTRHEELGAVRDPPLNGTQVSLKTIDGSSVLEAAKISTLGLYSLSVVNDDAAPRYLIGETIWIDPWRPAKANDDVYIEIINPATRERVSPGIIRECLRVESTSFSFARWAAGTQESLDRHDLALVQPIVCVTR